MPCRTVLEAAKQDLENSELAKLLSQSKTTRSRCSEDFTYSSWFHQAAKKIEYISAQQNQSKYLSNYHLERRKCKNKKQKKQDLFTQ